MDIEHHNYWEENSNTQLLKYENCNSNDGVANPAHQQPKDDTLFRCCDSNLNFATVACSEDDSEFSHYKKNKVSRQDPMSHRIIEKRRRDRMNNCLADLSRLIPADYLKKGRGRIEKTEIIEMAIRHIKYLQQSHRHAGREDTSTERGFNHEQYRLGYQECMSETMRFLVEVEGYFAREALCVRLINHLQKHCDDLLQERIQNTSISSEKDYSHMQSVSNLISPNINLNNNPVIRLQSPRQEHYENNSHLKDMLTGNIKDEINDHFIMNRQTRSDVDISISDEKNYNKNEYDYHKLQEHKKDEQLLKAELTDNHREYTNGASLYKFKNNIKQRFSQDLTAETNQQKIFKRRKLSEPIRRNSLTTETYSSENHSSPMDGSQCSPPSSEFRISSESENARISPTGSSVSDNRNSDRNRYVNLKPETNLNKPVNGFGRYSPVNKYPIKNTPVTPTIETDKTNFSVPIFALHAKGSFYIPLTIDYHTLVPYLQHNSVLDILPNVHNIILHPVTINVNFQSNYFNSINVRSIRPNKNKVEGQNGWH